jgi:Exocyst complex component Sec6
VSKGCAVILEQAQFVTEDLWNLVEYVQPCFPKDFEVIKLFQQHYREQIEAIIMPQLEKDINEKKSYGSLINLLKWIEKYETVVLRAGISDKNSMDNLKARAISLLPNFIAFLGDQFREMLQMAVDQDH